MSDLATPQLQRRNEPIHLPIQASARVFFSVMDVVFIGIICFSLGEPQFVG